MKLKRILPLLLVLLLTASLCSCGKKEQDSPIENQFRISLQATAGTGYYWDCVLSQEGIVAVESIQDMPDDLSPGSSVTTTFLFTGKKHGKVTATFYCRQSWDDSVFYQHTCDMEVDWDKIVTGELSSQTATICPGEGQYKLSLSDTSVALWTTENDSSFVFTPLRDGFTTLTFTPLDDSVTPSRFFYLRVADDGTITVTEQSDLINTGFFNTLEQLETNLGFPMPAPEEALIGEISSVDGMAYVTFVWDDVSFAYVGGDLDLDAFFSLETDVLTIGGCQVMIPNSSNTTAAWEKDDHVYYLSSEETISRENLLTLLNQILLPSQENP